MYVKIANGTIQIDPAGLELVERYAWSIGPHGYARARVESQDILLHRLLLDAQAGQQVDHINHDKLDNRRSNLRIATASQNAANRGPSSRNTSGYRGVYRLEATGRWVAQARKDGISHFGGTHETAEEAALAYNDLAQRLHGEFAYQNAIGGR